jgi:DNA-3-methyladenine glycosylase I
MADHRTRCAWATTPLGIVYHDEEWGVPVHDDRRLFEMLVLEGAQAGLSWETILRKRERYREVFEGFDPARVARYGPEEVERLLSDAGIVRHRGKIEAAITNARALLDVREELGSFDALVWSFVRGRPRNNERWTLAELPAKTPESEAMSRELRRRGFRFVGPTICYAFMQAVGLVNDHTVGCYRYAEIGGEPW